MSNILRTNIKEDDSPNGGNVPDLQFWSRTSPSGHRQISNCPVQVMLRNRLSGPTRRNVWTLNSQPKNLCEKLTSISACSSNQHTIDAQ